MIEGNTNYNHKIDFEKVYKILEILESLPGDNFEIEYFRELDINDNSNKLAYYLERMDEAGFVILKGRQDEGGNVYLEYPIITYKGHEYLANLRNDTIRNKVKEKIAKIGGSVSINLITKIVTEIVMRGI
jgi:hypothetical protein